MKKLVFVLVAGGVNLLSGCAAGPVSEIRTGNETSYQQFVACGWGNVSIFEFHPDSKTPVEETWFWKPQEYAGISDADSFYQQFHHIDECKPFDGGDRILITASTDGVGLIDRKSKTFIQFGTARNAHSADLLPGGRVAVATSHGGDRLIVFDGRELGRVLIEKPLPAGHGVHWDAPAQRLYALADQALDIYALSNWGSDKPDLQLVDSVRLPDGEGHNLSQIPEMDQLQISTASQTWLYDLSDREISEHPDLAGNAGVKSISTNAATGDIVWLSADPNGWWSYNIRFIVDKRDVTVPVNKRYYKVRWISPDVSQ